MPRTRSVPRCGRGDDDVLARSDLVSRLQLMRVDRCEPKLSKCRAKRDRQVVNCCGARGRINSRAPSTAAGVYVPSCSLVLCASLAGSTEWWTRCGRSSRACARNGSFNAAVSSAGVGTGRRLSRVLLGPLLPSPADLGDVEEDEDGDGALSRSLTHHSSTSLLCGKKGSRW